MVNVQCKCIIRRIKTKKKTVPVVLCIKSKNGINLRQVLSYYENKPDHIVG